MKKISNFALILTLAVTNCLAQNDWKPGYIIKNSGDTIHGYVDNRDSQSNSRKCHFRKEESGETEIFKAKDISGYRFNDGKFYVSKIIPGEDSIQKIFLEFVIQGGVNIYHYKDNMDHFFIEKDENLYELKNTSITKKTEETVFEAEKVAVVEKKEYLGILSSLLHEANMQQKINNSRLSSQSLINIAKEYHERVCAGEQCIVYSKQEIIHVKWGLHVGETISKFNFGNRFITDNVMNTFIGCHFKFENVLDWSENISFSADITLQKFAKCEIEEKKYSAVIKYNGINHVLLPGSKMDVDLKTLLLKVPITVNYTFSRGTVRPYISMGISNTFILSQNKDFQYLEWYPDYNGKSIPTFLVLGFIGRVGSEFIIKNKHILYADISYDWSTNARSTSMVFYNTMY
jgi:hypothetical protein